MSSGGMYGAALRTDDPQYLEESFSGSQAYARTKRMQVALARSWADELADDGTTVHSMHPGWVDTPGVAAYLPKFRAVTLPFMRTPDQGADTMVWLAAAPLPSDSSGRFWHDRQTRSTGYGRSGVDLDDAHRQELWDYCNLATNIQPGTVPSSS